ncbi:MAG: hypothetical protein ACLQU9_14095 [Acidimicrobiales bacterium]|jgi:hypothetical protein
MQRQWAGVVVLVALVVSGVACGGAAQAATTATGHPASPLRAPKTTPVEDATYLTDVAKADSNLATYVQQDGNVAFRAMLTDGAAFCAFLRQGGGIDTALADVALGAHSVESQTHLPLSVHTFNTLESVAMIDLCAGEQHLVPASVRAKLHQLAASLRSSADSQEPASG